jgi:hypothetical protein
MPKQKAKPVKKEEVIPEQVMDPQRIARLEAQQAQVTAMEAANQAAMVSASGNLYFAQHPLINMFLYRKGSSKRRNVNARRRRPKPGRGKPRRRRNPNLRKRERSKALIYTSAILAHIAYNMYVGLKNDYVLSKFKPKQLCLEYHKMKSTILTLDESRKEFKPSGFAQTHFLDENNKKIDENHNNPKKLNSQFFTLTTRVKPFLTKSCNRAELKMNSHVIYHKDYG